MRFYPVLKTWTSLVALPLVLGACAFLIPDNPSDPRYNEVLGGRRMPQENMRMQGGGGAPRTPGDSSSMSAPVMPVAQQSMDMQPTIDTSPAYMSQGQPVPPAPAPQPVQAMDLPPVSPQTQQIAQQRIEQSGDRTLMDRVAFWRDDEPASPRAIPQENAAMSNSSYPVLSDVPPAPASTATAQQRLDAVRAELERDRMNSGHARATQAQNAAMDAAAPVPAPVYTAPAPPPVVTVPPASQVRSAPLPPPPSYSPPAYTPAPVAAAPAPIQMDAIPMANAPAPAASVTYYPAAPAMEPIQLRPPVNAAPQPAPRVWAAPQPAPAPSYRAMSPSTSSFDPMAGASYAPTAMTPYSTGNTGYLAPSRYTYRR